MHIAYGIQTVPHAALVNPKIKAQSIGLVLQTTMAGLGKNLNTVALAVGKTLKTNSGSAVNIVICLVTVGSEQLFSFAIFNCPCSIPVLSYNNSQEERKDPLRAGLVYGSVFIVVPAFILFLLGCAMNIKIWKLMTGCRYRHLHAARGYRAGCATLMEIVMQAMVAPCTWVSIAFLDGKYYACAVAVEPYDMTCADVVRASFRNLKFTTEYESYKQKSQVIGWIFISFCLFSGSVIYMVYRWCSDLTYHHRHYMKWYQNIESEQFEKIAKEQLTEQAKENIDNFLSETRKKKEWDSISTVFTFKRNEDDYAIYSRLDDWNESHPLLSKEDEREDDEDTSKQNKQSVNADDPSEPASKRSSGNALRTTESASAENIPLKEMTLINSTKPIHNNVAHDKQSNESVTKYATCRFNANQAKSAFKNNEQPFRTIHENCNNSNAPLLSNFNDSHC